MLPDIRGKRRRNFGGESMVQAAQYALNKHARLVIALIEHLPRMPVTLVMSRG